MAPERCWKCLALIGLDIDLGQSSICPTNKKTPAASQGFIEETRLFSSFFNVVCKPAGPNHHEPRR
jgi:hypothetical protein